MSNEPEDTISASSPNQASKPAGVNISKTSARLFGFIPKCMNSVLFDEDCRANLTPNDIIAQLSADQAFEHVDKASFIGMPVKWPSQSPGLEGLL